MAPKKKVSALLKLQIQAGKANPAPPLGPALGSHGVNIMDFCKQYNAATQDKMGQVIPVEITVFEDRSFTFILKTPPAAALLKKAAGIQKGTENPLTHKVGSVTKAQVREIAEIKMADLSATRRRGRHEDHRGHRPLDGYHGYRLRGEGQMVKRSKKYREASEKIDRNNLYTANEAIALVKSMPEYKFDQTVEAVLRLNVDPRKADQLVRGSVNLPNGTGKTAKVLVFARGPKATEALEAGADIVGDDDLVQKVADGFLDFDSVVATPDMMGKVGRLGRVLGPRGLMPNPKTGTVTMDVTKAIKDIKGGKVDFRVDKNGNLSFLIGKLSFTEQALDENFKAVADEIKRLKPSTVKGRYVTKATITSTMNPGVPVDPTVIA